MKQNAQALRANPFTMLPDLKLVPIPDQIQTHEHRVQLRSYLSRSDDPLRSLAEALTSGRKPKTVEVTKTVGPPEPEETEAPAAAPTAPTRWGRS